MLEIFLLRIQENIFIKYLSFIPVEIQLQSHHDFLYYELDFITMVLVWSYNILTRLYYKLCLEGSTRTAIIEQK